MVDRVGELKKREEGAEARYGWKKQWDYNTEYKTRR